MTLTAVLAVLLLLVESPMPERSKIMTQTKRNTLVLYVGGWSVRLTYHPFKKLTVEKPSNECQMDTEKNGHLQLRRARLSEGHTTNQ